MRVPLKRIQYVSYTWPIERRRRKEGVDAWISSTCSLSRAGGVDELRRPVPFQNV